MSNDGTVKLVPCPNCKGSPNPACKLCNGSGVIPADAQKQ